MLDSLFNPPRRESHITALARIRSEQPPMWNTTTTTRETSQLAAQAARKCAATMREQVYQFIASRGDYGATDDEIQRGLDMNPSSQRPRRIELQRADRIVNSGETRRTASGRAAVVWKVKA